MGMVFWGWFGKKKKKKGNEERNKKNNKANYFLTIFFISLFTSFYFHNITLLLSFL